MSEKEVSDLTNLLYAYVDEQGYQGLVASVSEMMRRDAEGLLTEGDDTGHDLEIGASLLHGAAEALRKIEEG